MTIRQMAIEFLSKGNGRRFFSHIAPSDFRFKSNEALIEMLREISNTRCPESAEAHMLLVKLRAKFGR